MASTILNCAYSGRLSSFFALFLSRCVSILVFDACFLPSPSRCFCFHPLQTSKLFDVIIIIIIITIFGGCLSSSFSVAALPSRRLQPDLFFGRVELVMRSPSRNEGISEQVHNSSGNSYLLAVQMMAVFGHRPYVGNGSTMTQQEDYAEEHAETPTTTNTKRRAVIQVEGILGCQ